MTDKWWRVTGAFGLGWFVLFAVGAIVLQGEPPPFNQPAAEARGFFAARGGRYLVGDYLAGLAFIFGFLPFVVGLRSLLGRAEGGLQVGSRLLLVAGMTTVVVGDAATVFTDAMALAGGGAELNDATIHWLAVIGSIAGVLHVAGAAFPIQGEPDGVLFTLRFLGLIAFALFVLLTSISMLTMREPRLRDLAPMPR